MGILGSPISLSTTGFPLNLRGGFKISLVGFLPPLLLIPLGLGVLTIPVNRMVPVGYPDYKDSTAGLVS